MIQSHFILVELLSMSRPVLASVLTSFDLVNLSYDALPYDLLNSFNVNSSPADFALLHGLTDVDVEPVMSLDVVVVVDLHQGQHRRCGVDVFRVFAIQAFAEVTCLALLGEEVLDNPILGVDL